MPTIELSIVLDGKRENKEDEDGVATEESMSRYSTKHQFAVSIGVTAVGLAVSFALAVFATVRRENSFSESCLTQLWLLFPAWVSEGPCSGSAA